MSTTEFLPTTIVSAHEETIRKVAKEGLEARNLLNFIADGSLNDVVTSKKPPTSPRPQSVSPKPPSFDINKTINVGSLPRTAKRRTALSRPKNRLRSASAGRNPEKDLRTRYWTFLFENLHRAVDEIYQTCEMDESIVESKEAIMMLENYSKDFHALIQYININKNYERTAPPNRPTSLAWEVRKSSPGKSLLKNVFIEKLTTGSNAKRILCFDSTSDINSSKIDQFPKQQQMVNIVESSHCNNQPCDSEIVEELRPLDLSNESGEQCEIKISVIPESSDSNFPCNDNLVVNEVNCCKDKIPTLELQKETAEVGDTEFSSENKSKPPNSTTADISFNSNDIVVNKAVNLIDEKIIPNSVPPFEYNESSTQKAELPLTRAKSIISDSAKNKASLKRSKSSLTDSPNVSKPIVKGSDANSSTKAPLKKASLFKNGKDKVDVKEKLNVQKNNILEGKAKVQLPTCGKEKSLNKQETISSTQSNKRSVSDITFLNESVPFKCNQVKKIDCSKAIVEDKVSATCNNKQSLKNAISNTVIKPEISNSSSCEKFNNVTDKKKPVKPKSAESAIKRNISYVSALSSRNQREKYNNEMKKPSRPLSGNLKHFQKSGSMVSLNKTTAPPSSARKTLSVEKIPEAVKSSNDDDSDGWEMVRGRNRSRNSPAKKLPFLSKNSETQAAQFAKLSQSRIGGFPYTNKSNLRTVLKPPSKPETLKKNNKQEVKNDNTENKLLQAKTKQSPPSNKIEESSKTDISTSRSSEKCSDLCDKTKKPTLEEKASVFISYDDIWLKDLPRNSLNSDGTFGQLLKGFSCNNFRSNCITRSQSTSCLHSKSLLTLNFMQDFGMNKMPKSLCLSDPYLGNCNYIIIKKRLSEKGLNSAKKKIKKAKMINNSSPQMNPLNGSLDESDNGLTSDDQDGALSHDEFDVQCQELDDTAWKYKILEQQVRKLELSWGEQMDLFDMELRTPGRALEMHEKLSSPFRKKSLLESIRVCNEKQLKAQEQRERLLVEKAQKFKIIEKKRLEMKALIEERQEKQRVIMEQKLQRAEEKRKKQLQMIIRKAHDEEEKVNEIAFINTLEAQNKRHDLISKEKDHEARLQDIQEERQRKQEEKAAKEAAAEERRKILEAERLARLNEMQEKRKIRDHKVEQLFLVKEKERQELANQKARDRELRLSALNAQQQTTIEELQKKIQLKQEESARRHEENMEQIRQKAFELSIRRCSSNNDDVPQPVPYDTKKICTICNVLIGSEVYLLSHLHGKKHQEAVKNQYQGQDPSSEELELYNLKHIVDASTDQLDPNIALDKERQKALKKRCKKLRQRMTNRGQEFETEFVKNASPINSNVKTKMDRVVNEVKKLLSLNEKSCVDSTVFVSVERCLNEIDSLLKKQFLNNRTAFQAVGGITALVDIFKIVSLPQSGNNALISKKTINHLSCTAESLIDKSHDVCKFILFTNKIGNLLDLLINRLNCLIPDNISQLIANNMTKSGEMNIKVDMSAWKLIHLLTGILINLSVEYSCLKSEENNDKSSSFQTRLQDMISYIVSIGIIDKLSQFFNSIQVPISNEEEIAAFLLECIHFLTTLIKLCTDCLGGTTNQKVEDTTQLVATFRVTNMVGVVSFLYGLLLHKGSSSRGEVPPKQFSKQIEVLAHSAIQMLNHMALMNLQAFQSILGSEGLSLQLRHIVSHLLWYCSHLTSENLLHEIIILVGYFSVLNAENQSIIQAGQRPTVLQQLCCLPFLYFSDPELTDILFPTLITCCYKNSSNKEILQQEMSSELLSNYIEVKLLNLEDENVATKKNKNITANICFNKYWSFPVRFPKCHWSLAKRFFAVE